MNSIPSQSTSIPYGFVSIPLLPNHSTRATAKLDMPRPRALVVALAKLNIDGSDARRKREDEIQSKLLALKKAGKLIKTDKTKQREQDGNKGQEQQSDANPNPQSNEDKLRGKSLANLGWDDLPDEKKEQILMREMSEAESFLDPNKWKLEMEEDADQGMVQGVNQGMEDVTSDSAQNESESETDGLHKPKVSTWGLYPRPRDISRTYGGGKNVPLGGVNLNTAEQAKALEETANRLAAYRQSLGIDPEKEEEHREEIEAALRESEVMMNQSRYLQAIETLQKVEPLVSIKSLNGGKINLQLALCYDVTGKEDKAQDLYGKLARSPFSEISRKAKQLAFGFQARSEMGYDSTREAMRVMNYKLPDFATLTTLKGRYDTTYSKATSAKEREIRERMGQLSEEEARNNNVVFFVFLAIILTIVANLVLRMKQ